MRAAFTIYTVDASPYGELAKALLRRRGIPFEEIVVQMDDDAQWSALVARSGRRTMPQIFAGERFVGGYGELKSAELGDDGAESWS
jgi:glutaredoxin 3